MSTDLRYGIEYLLSLKVGERVVETEPSNCYFGMTGLVYESERGKEVGPCVKWEDGMGTSVTHGTRRIRDVLKDLEYAKADARAQSAACVTLGKYLDEDKETIAKLRAEQAEQWQGLAIDCGFTVGIPIPKDMFIKLVKDTIKQAQGKKNE